MADCLWISKSDLIGAAQLGDLCERLHEQNPSAEVLWAGARGEEALMQLVVNGAGAGAIRSLPAAQRLQPHGPDCPCCKAKLQLPGTDRHLVRTCVVERATPLRAEVLGAWMERLMQAWGGEILRMKGMVCLDTSPEQPWLLQGVQGHCSAPQKLARWPSSERVSRIVFIGTNLESEEIDRSLREIEGSLEML